MLPPDSFTQRINFIAELNDFKTRRISHFRKNFVDEVELEVKHAKVSPTPVPILESESVLTYTEVVCAVRNMRIYYMN